MRALLVTCALLAACGGAEPGMRRTADRVHAGDLLLHCPPDGPVRVDLPAHAVVATWLCSEDGSRCTPIRHALQDDHVEVSCVGSPGRPRRIRWMAPAP